MQVLVQVRIAGALGKDLAHGVQHRSVVASAEHFANFRQTFLRELLGQIHRDLAWFGNVGRTLLAVHVGHLDLVEICHGLLDVFHADLAVLDGEQVAQRIAHEADVDGPATEARIGQDVLQRAFKLAHVGAHVLGHEKCHVFGQVVTFGLRLAQQNGHAHFQFGRLDRHSQTRIKARDQACRDVGQPFWIGVAGHDDMTFS